MSATSNETTRMTRRNILVLLLPLVVFLGLAVLFYAGLLEGDPSRLPSALIGRPALCCRRSPALPTMASRYRG
jgi:cytochrome c biogenesis protein CcmG/thiol:disulfide interchange protein DsbE